MLQAMLSTYDNLANPIGIYREPSKGSLVLPSSAPWPLDRHLVGPRALRPNRQGIVISGAPIGTAEFVASVAADKVITSKQRVDAIVQLAKLDPQMGMVLLGACANNALNYFVRVTQPSPIRDAVASFDRMIADARLQCITPEDSVAPFASELRLYRSNWLQELKIAQGGTGQTPLALKAGPSFLASILSAAEDEFVGDRMHLVGPALSGIHETICHDLGVTEITAGHALAAVLPCTSSKLMDGTYARTFKKKKSWVFKSANYHQ